MICYQTKNSIKLPSPQLKAFNFTPGIDDWMLLPKTMQPECNKIAEIASDIKEHAEMFIVVGIGGSYTGSRAVIEALQTVNHNEFRRPQIYFMGNSLDSDELSKMISIMQGKTVYINYVSKSGTTLEPNVVFPILKDYIEAHCSKNEVKKRIIITAGTNSELYKSSKKDGYTVLGIPESVPGRFSVLSAAGLLPIAVSGIDIVKLLEGAYEEMLLCANAQSPACNYAVERQNNYSAEKKIELLALPSESFRFFGEWWKQLFAESEGKNRQGIFPVYYIVPSDLHSLGQYIQDGEQNHFETFLSFHENRPEVELPEIKRIYDCIENGVIEAHTQAHIPCSSIIVPGKSEKELGSLIYFFEYACVLSSSISGADPYTQPGVEKYKESTRRLLSEKSIKIGF